MNTKEGLIGVILPVYKVEKYIAVINKSIYNYRLTPQSAVHTHDNARI